MNCTCPKWKYKELKTTCACGGVAYYQKIDKINDKDNKIIILQKLKDEVSQLRTDITIKKMEIRELEDAILKSSNNDFLPQKRGFNASISDELETEKPYVILNGNIITKAGLPNCDCKNCS